MAVLIGMSGDVKGKSFPIDGDELTVGRSSDNKVSINNASVSGHHAAIARDGDHYVLRDLGSTNGTRVNSHETKEHILKPKDLIQFGSVEFLFNSEVMSPEDAQAAVFTKTEETVADGSTAKPATFNSISPFGARRRENQALWTTILIILGGVALLVVAYLFYRLLTA